MSSIRTTASIASPSRRVAIVGGGRLGSALAAALTTARVEVVGPLGRKDDLRFDRADVVLLTVPDAAIAAVAASIAAGPTVGHCSGALPLEVLGSHEGFSMHPLLSVTTRGARFEGAAAAIAGRTSDALDTARWLAESLRMEPVVIDDAVRPLYHAAASMAANYLVTLEDAAEQLAARTGIQRRHLARLAESALENWSELGGRAALTGPIVRGDESTVERQRAAVARVASPLLPLWDSLADATRELARQPLGGA
jgi:predicted short-subunit dehydrogenase-like oxidoreductase (DUF2520 family)